MKKEKTMNGEQKKISAFELVGILKGMRTDLLILGINATDVDFLGASLPYVKEKADALIEEVKSWKRWLTEVEKRNKSKTPRPEVNKTL